MNDDQNKPNITQDDPLSVLENILNEAKKKGATSGKSSGGGDSSVLDNQSTPEEVEAVRLQQEMESQRLEMIRQEQILAQKAKIQQELPKTPQFIARQQQEAEEDIQEKANISDDGLVIHQMSHTKI